MTSKRIKFNKKALQSLPNAETRDYYYDLNEKALVLQVTSAGAKTYYLYRRIDGKPERVKIANFDDISIEKAREKAAALKGKIAEGRNPQNEKRAIRQEITFKETFDKYINDHAKLHTKSWQQDVEDIERNLKHWYNRKLSSITKDEIQKLHAEKAKKKKPEYGGRVLGGKGSANRLLDRVNAIFNKAIEWGWEGKNPAKGVKKFKLQSRDRFLQPDELERFFKSLELETNIAARDYVYLSLLTGARKSNVLAMSWDEISLERAEWRIPETKNGEAQTIPLVEEAVRILRGRSNSKESNKYVFPGIGKAGHLADPKKAWKRILQRAEITNLRIHDLRRSMGSYQAMLGANSYTIGKSLGHKSQAATAIYARMNLDPVRASMEAATKRMMGFKQEQSDG